jgi:hypothetical protein
MSSTGTGVTSTLGMLGLGISSRANSGTGIPLGATEINPGGLSPAPVSNLQHEWVLIFRDDRIEWVRHCVNVGSWLGI